MGGAQQKFDANQRQYSNQKISGKQCHGLLVYRRAEDPEISDASIVRTLQYSSLLVYIMRSSLQKVELPRRAPGKSA